MMLILLECNHFNSLEAPTEMSHSTISWVPHLMGYIKITREDLKGRKTVMGAQIPPPSPHIHTGFLKWNV